MIDPSRSTNVDGWVASVVATCVPAIRSTIGVPVRVELVKAIACDPTPPINLLRMDVVIAVVCVVTPTPFISPTTIAAAGAELMAYPNFVTTKLTVDVVGLNRHNPTCVVAIPTVVV